MRNYAWAQEQMHGRESKKIANNTYLQLHTSERAVNPTGPRVPVCITMKLHETPVVTFYPDGHVVLDSGGWRTVTTKERMSYVLPIRQERGKWYVRVSDGVSERWVPYADGMAIWPDGRVEGAGEETLKEDAKLKQRIARYAKLCADAVPLAKPSASDCWHCALETDKGQVLGDVIKSDHLVLHMDEGYVVSSLVYHALEEHGAGLLHYRAVFGPPDASSTYMRELSKREVRHAVYRYMCKRFGFAL